MSTSQAVTSSPRFTLNLRDIAIGLTISVGTSVFSAFLSLFENGDFWNWDVIWKAALGGFMAYIGKNFFDKAKIVIPNPTPKQVEAVKDGDAKVEVTPN